jgi:uncharacterized membrane protein
LFGVLLWRSRIGAALAALVGAVASVFLIYVDNNSEFTASYSQLTIKIHEADSAIAALRRLALLTGQSLILIDGRIGSLGGDSDENRAKLKADVTQTLKDMGIDDDAIRRATEDKVR